LPCTQEPCTCPYPEPYQSSPYHPIVCLLRSILILFTHLRLGVRSGLFSSGFRTSYLYAFLLSQSVLHTLPISSQTLLFKLHLRKSTRYEAAHCAFFSTFLSLHPSSIPLFSSTPCSKTSSVYVRPLMSETKVRTHTESQAKLQFYTYTAISVKNIAACVTCSEEYGKPHSSR
jgi:hypothetical protein